MANLRFQVIFFALLAVVKCSLAERINNFKGNYSGFCYDRVTQYLLLDIKGECMSFNTRALNALLPTYKCCPSRFTATSSSMTLRVATTNGLTSSTHKEFDNVVAAVTLCYGLTRGTDYQSFMPIVDLKHGDHACKDTLRSLRAERFNNYVALGGGLSPDIHTKRIESVTKLPYYLPFGGTGVVRKTTPWYPGSCTHPTSIFTCDPK